MTTNAQGVRETAGERIEESVQGSDSPGGTVSHVNGRKGRGRLIAFEDEINLFLLSDGRGKNLTIP